ncbi:hypothetical protein AC249_AIPGENE5046, partial [Exaiptasia diaphana]
DDEKVKYIEGLIGVRFPKDGYGKLYRKVNEEWKASGESGLIQSRAGRVYDSVLTIAYGVKDMIRANITITPPRTNGGMCQSNDSPPWRQGSRFFKMLKGVRKRKS